MTEGFDVGMEMSGNPSAFRDLLRTMHHGGNVALLGIPPNELAIDWNEVIFKGLTLKGIYGREMFETWYKMSSMLQSGLDLDPIITHRFPGRRLPEGVRTDGIRTIRKDHPRLGAVTGGVEATGWRRSSARRFRVDRRNAAAARPRLVPVPLADRRPMAVRHASPLPGSRPSPANRRSIAPSN